MEYYADVDDEMVKVKDDIVDIELYVNFGDFTVIVFDGIFDFSWYFASRAEAVEFFAWLVVIARAKYRFDKFLAICHTADDIFDYRTVIPDDVEF